MPLHKLDVLSMKFPDIDQTGVVKFAFADTELLMEVIEWTSASEITGAVIVIPDLDVRQVRRTFPLNSKLAELVARSGLRVYSTETDILQTLVFSGEHAYHLFRFGTMEQFIELSAEPVLSAIDSEFSRIVEAAKPVEVDILAWSELLEKLEEMVDSQTRQEFERLIQAARFENLGALDDISVAIIAAAQSEALLNDLSTWAEEVGLSSKATFSRRKGNLEDSGIVRTEKVPIEVGRPKLRLKLADDIGAVRIDGSDIGVTRTGHGNKNPTASNDSPSSDTNTERTDQKPDENENDILASIEQEIQDAIRSK